MYAPLCFWLPKSAIDGKSLHTERLNKFSLCCQSSPFPPFTKNAETKLNPTRLHAKHTVLNSHRQTAGASGWKSSKETGCYPPRPSGSLSRFVRTASPPSDWSSRCSLEDRDAGAHLQGNNRRGFGSISVLKYWEITAEIKKKDMTHASDIASTGVEANIPTVFY